MDTLQVQFSGKDDISDQVRISMIIYHGCPLSGYGSTSNVVAKALDKSGIKEPLEKWDEETVKKIVEYFMDERFPTIVVCVFCIPLDLEEAY